MTKNPNIHEAIKSLDNNIKLLESMKKNIMNDKEPMLSHAMYASWCLHRYIHDKLSQDMEKAVKKYGSH